MKKMFNQCNGCDISLHNTDTIVPSTCLRSHYRRRKRPNTKSSFLNSYRNCDRQISWLKTVDMCVVHVLFGALIFGCFTNAYGSHTTNNASDTFVDDNAIFVKRTIIRPNIYGEHHGRPLETTKQESGIHLSKITVEYMHNNQKVLADLELNKKLLPEGHFLRYQDKKGGKIVQQFTKFDLDFCHYHGKIRNRPDSYVALSTCNGIQGIVADGNETYYIHRTDDTFFQNDHILLRQSDMVSNSSCGLQDDMFDMTKRAVDNKIRRKRSSSAATIRMPYNSNAQSSFVELVLVVDNKVYKGLGENLKKTHARCQEIANIINALYVPLNIFIVLVGVVVWNENNEVELSSDGDKTLKNFLHYRRKVLVKDHPNDNAQLLTKETFEGGVVGKALKGPICTYEFSGGVSMDHSNIISVVATTVAHEMGHNFGMEHDSTDCKCPDDRCIMSASSSSVAPLHWSSCSIDQLNLALHQGMNYCLKNQPTSIFDTPQCGNGFVELGEQCDCGLPQFCQNSCCNPVTCMLRSNASCATGKCCDLQTCQPHQAGVMCRAAEGECDLPEYCTGESEFCPSDYFKRDTELCGGEKARCYKGACRSRDDQCKLLWGPSGKSSEQCYEKNTEGTRHGNCGYDRFSNTYFNCSKENVFCGLLQCRHLNERLEFGMESVSVLSHSFISHESSIIPCRTAIVDLGLQSIDPGLTPDGSICGVDRMCVSQKCVAIEDFKKDGLVLDCPDNCSGHGVCDNAGHCHCEKGFAPPTCDSPGPGGSEHSGPASNPADGHSFARVLYVFFLGVVPFISLSLFLMYYWQQNRALIMRRVPSEFKISLRRNPPADRPPPAPPAVKPSAPPHDEMNTSLLNVPNGVDNSLGKNMFGQFKGFTLKPLPMTKPSIVGASNVAYVHPVSKNIDNEASNEHIPVRVAPPPPVPSVHKAQSISEKPIVSTLLRTASNVSASFLKDHSSQHQLQQNLPPSKPEIKERPKISSPIWNTSTCTSAKELISNRINQFESQAVSSQPTKHEPIPYIEHVPQSPPPVNRVEYDKPASKLNAQSEQSNGLVKKKSFRDLEISAPIKNVNFGRSQSMRDAPSQSPFKRNKEAATVSRVYGKKRPNSIVDRPRNPPPRPPGPPGMVHSASASASSLTHSKEYDDCEAAPTSIDTVPDKGDNLYCIIDEVKSPPVPCGSNGLLNEIVNEIETRNLHSIYSQAKKPKKQPDNLYDEVPSIYENDARDDISPVPPELPKPNEKRGEKMKDNDAPMVPIKPAYVSPIVKTNSPASRNIRGANMSSFRRADPPAVPKAATVNYATDQSTTATNKTNGLIGDSKPKKPEPLSKKPPVQINRTLSGRTTSPHAPTSTVLAMQKRFESGSAPNTITKK